MSTVCVKSLTWDELLFVLFAEVYLVPDEIFTVSCILSQAHCDQKHLL